MSPREAGENETIYEITPGEPMSDDSAHAPIRSVLADKELHIDGAVVGPLIGAAVTVSVDHDGNTQEGRTRRAGTTGYGEVV